MGIAIVFPSLAKDFRYKIRLAWVDTDAARIAHFTSFLKYVERAEEELYNLLGLSYTSSAEGSNATFPRVEVFCRYLSPARFNDQLEVILRVTEIKERSVKTEFSVFNQTSGRVSAEGYFVGVTASVSVSESVRLSKEFVSKIKQYFEL